MPVKRYDKKVKAAIIEATTTARSDGKSWNEAFKAAKEAGYTGSLGGLEQMIRNAALKSKKQAVRKLGRPAGKRRGRPPMQTKAAVQRRGPGRPPKTGDLSSIEAIVASVVKKQVNEVLDKAIAVLQQAKS
ncbi:MAG TPA: hypothetical protein VGP72_31355 [Planctomycetota bacterium]|jgi:hypothetical protein